MYTERRRSLSTSSSSSGSLFWLLCDHQETGGRNGWRLRSSRWVEYYDGGLGSRPIGAPCLDRAVRGWQAEGVRLSQNWLADLQKQRPDPAGNSSSLTVTPCIRVLKESQTSIYIQRCLARDLSVTPAVRDRSVYSHVTRAVTFWRRGALGKLTCNTCRYTYINNYYYLLLIT
jgi:hypothetical protein